MNIANETILRIDLKKLEENFNFFKKKLDSETKIIAVVKAFAYGHGDVKISKKLDQLGVYALWVSDFEEGVSLRESGIKTKIIVANPGIKSYRKIISQHLDVVLYSHRLLDFYCNNKKDVNVHIKFNTGMNRYGFDPDDVKIIISKLIDNPHLKLISICSHLASAENKKSDCTLKQITLFQNITQKITAILNKKIIFHLLNSNGVLNFPEKQMDAVRLGIGLYGSADECELKQISSLSSVINQIRVVEKGGGVGYRSSFVATQKTSIAIIHVGYADGLNRKLSNSTGSVFINNHECTIIGEISMDSFAADITGVKAKEGDLVEIFGPQLNVLEIAKKLNTIPYEIYSTLNRRIKRVYSDS